MYKRIKKGKGFSYRNEDGTSLTDKEKIDWIKKLVIPPAWTEVEIVEDEDADLLVTGRDQKGRKQYIYNPAYREQQDQTKFEKIIRFGDQLEHMRRVTGQHLRKKKMPKEKVLACMVRLLDAAYFRPGSPKYTQENQSYGLTTLRSKHLTVEGDELIFAYRGKSGKDQIRQVEDAKLAKIVAELDEMPGYRIFKYFDENGVRRDIESADLNAYIRDIMGEEFSAKDFRTWAGTMIAAAALDELGVCGEDEQKELEKRIKNAVIRVSEKLGNTPSVARSSYIDPRIFESYAEGHTTAYYRKEVDKMLASSENLSVEELGVLCLLKKRLKKNKKAAKKTAKKRKEKA